MSAQTEITVAIAVGAVAYVPILPTYAKVAASALGVGLFLEGLTRVKQRRHRAIQFRWDDHPAHTQLGSCKAVFVTRNSLLDSVVITCMIVAMACGLAWIVDLMATNAGIDGNFVKGLVCLILVPAIMLYCAYRAVRLKIDRRTLFLHEHGLFCEHRSGEDVINWNDLSCLTAVHLGDAIDEDAIDFEFRTPRKKRRITRAQFPLIEKIWVRILQEAAEQIEQGQLEVRSLIQSRSAAG